MTEGRVIYWKGGPEVIPISEQFQALQSGVVDVVVTGHINELPAAFALPLSQLKPWGAAGKRSLNEVMVEEHETIGVRYLGRWLTDHPAFG